MRQGAGCLVADAEGGRAGAGRQAPEGRGQYGNTDLMRRLEAGAVEQCLAGTAADRRAFVRFCQAMCESAIIRAMCRRGPRYRDLARDGFQDLCCLLLAEPSRVLGRFDASRASLRIHLTRWVCRRVWVLIHRYERCDQRLPLADAPEARDPTPAEAGERAARLKEQARPALRSLTRTQRRLVEAILEGRSEVLHQLSQAALRKMLYRISRRLRDSAGAARGAV
jgi:hypothetical protein